MTPLDDQRDDLIARIKAVFPKNPPGKGKRGVRVSTSYDKYSKRELETLFEGKRWQDVVYEPNLLYRMTDADYLASMTQKAFVYYFPALLVASINAPATAAETWLYSSYFSTRLTNMLNSFSVEQLQTIVGVYEYIAAFWREWRDEGIVSSLETLQLALMLYIDKRMASEKS
jgi:hypothetical protein